MKRDTAILIIATLTIVELTIIAAIAYKVYQKVSPTIAGLGADYQGIGGLINLFRHGSPTTTGTS